VTRLLGRRSPELRRAARDAVADRPLGTWLAGLAASLARAATSPGP
jgi:hypothetical protein